MKCTEGVFITLLPRSFSKFVECYVISEPTYAQKYKRLTVYLICFTGAILTWHEKRGRGVVVVLFMVANNALENKQISLTDEEYTNPDHKDSLCQCSNMPWLSDKFVGVDKEA